MKQFGFKIMAMNKTFYAGPCAKLIANTLDGKIEILANHQSAVFAVVSGELQFSVDGDTWTDVVTGNGFVAISDNEAVLIVDTAERPEDIDIIRAQEAKERAEEQMLHTKSHREFLHSKASLARAMVRLKATSKYNK